MKICILVFFAFFVLANAGLIHPSENHDLQQQHLSSAEHENLDAHFSNGGDENEEEFEDCICEEGGEEIEESDAFENGNSTRVKRCGCGYGYCGCTAPAAPAAGGGGNGGGNGGGGPKNVFVVPFPMPAPSAPAPAAVPAPVPSPASQTIVLPPQTQIPQQPYIVPQTSLLTGGNGNGENACDRLRLILTLTNQLEGLKLIEIAGQCVVQVEK